MLDAFLHHFLLSKKIGQCVTSDLMRLLTAF
jgi:hypothetical protein